MSFFTFTLHLWALWTCGFLNIFTSRTPDWHRLDPRGPADKILGFTDGAISKKVTHSVFLWWNYCENKLFPFCLGTPEVPMRVPGCKWETTVQETQQLEFVPCFVYIKCQTNNMWVGAAGVSRWCEVLWFLWFLWPSSGLLTHFPHGNKPGMENVFLLLQMEEFLEVLQLH